MHRCAVGKVKKPGIKENMAPWRECALAGALIWGGLDVSYWRQSLSLGLNTERKPRSSQGKGLPTQLIIYFSTAALETRRYF